MARTLLDKNLFFWEAYASTGAFGFADRAHIVFNCLSDRLLRPRYVVPGGDKADAEKQVETATDAELLRLLEQALPLGRRSEAQPALAK